MVVSSVMTPQHISKRTTGGDSRHRRRKQSYYLKYYFVALGTFLIAFILTSQLQLHKIKIKSLSSVKPVNTNTATENDVLLSDNDNDRYFTYKPSTTTGEDVNRGNEYYIKHLVSLVQRSWDHYERRRYLDYYLNLLWTRSTLPKIVNNAEQTLYVGFLGPCVYLRYRLATSPSFPLMVPFHSKADGNDVVTTSRIKMLKEALHILDDMLPNVEKLSTDNTDTHHPRVTLLEGSLVGTLSLKIVVTNAILGFVEDKEDCSALIEGIESAKTNLLLFGQRHILDGALASSECEVVYGRSGYLKAIKFVQREIDDPDFGLDMARKIVQEIWVEGTRRQDDVFDHHEEKEEEDDDNDKVAPLPLLWKWHGKTYLGVAHGITGVIHSLLDFQHLLDTDAMKYIEATTTLLREDMCTESGNLASSITSTGEAKKSDRLVQWCHGSPGHVLLLAQMARTTQNVAYLDTAKDLAASVIQPRGLLKKGCGLCHGISGNAFVFLSLANAERVLRGGGGDGHDHVSEQWKWTNATYEYANFALDHLMDIQDVPDRPYSLYEGMAGLSCLLLALIEGGEGPSSNFPLYEL